MRMGTKDLADNHRSKDFEMKQFAQKKTSERAKSQASESRDLL